MADKGLHSSRSTIAVVLLGALVFAVAVTQMGGTVSEGTAAAPQTSVLTTVPAPEPSTEVSRSVEGPVEFDAGSSSKPFVDSGSSSATHPTEVKRQEAVVEHRVASAAQWASAVAVAQPGDVIRLVADIPTRLVYRGGNDGRRAEGANGAPGKPIVITADPGVWIDGGSVSSNFGGLDIFYANHVHAVGLNVRNAQFGIRCLQCEGTAEHPIKITGNRTTNVGYVGIHVGGHLKTHAPSRHVVISGNTVSDTGKLTARFGEGIYLGHGSNEWVDKTANIVVSSNEIFNTTAEAIDIKPGTSDVLVEKNRIHDTAPIDGGAISAHYVNNKANPNPDQLASVIVRENWIWNHNRNGAPGASDAAIWVGHGGVDIIGNYIWGFRSHGNTRGVRVRSPKPFGPHKVTIKDNVFWLDRGWVADGYPSPHDSVVSSNNLGPNVPGVDVVVGADHWWGEVPPIGQAGDADRGEGPGSSFVEPSEPETATAPVVPVEPEHPTPGSDPEPVIEVAMTTVTTTVAQVPVAVHHTQPVKISDEHVVAADTSDPGGGQDSSLYASGDSLEQDVQQPRILAFSDEFDGVEAHGGPLDLVGPEIENDERPSAPAPSRQAASAVEHQSNDDSEASSSQPRDLRAMAVPTSSAPSNNGGLGLLDWLGWAGLVLCGAICGVVCLKPLWRLAHIKV